MAKYENYKIWFWDDDLAALGSTTNVLSARYKCGIDTVGEGEFTIPLVDTPARQYIAEYNVATFTVEIDGETVCFGEIIIDDIDEIITSDNKGYLRVSGPGRMSKLTLDRMNFQVISNGSGGRVNTATADVLALSQYATWNIDETSFSGAYVTPSAYLVSTNENLFDAVHQTLIQNNHHSADQPGQVGAISGTPQAPENRIYLKYNMDQLSPTPGGGFSGWHFKTGADPAVGVELPILAISKVKQEREIVTRAIVHGGGLGTGQFTISAASGTKTAPSGYSYDFTNSVITNTALEATQPRKVGLAKLSNIKPEDPEDSTSVLTAAEQLVDAGQRWLEERQGGYDTFYRVSSIAVMQAQGSGAFTVWPGYITGARLTISKNSPYNTSGSLASTNIISIDSIFHILEVAYSVQAGTNGSMLMGDYLLGPAPRQERSGAEMIADMMKLLERRLDHAEAGGAGSSVPSGTNYITTDAPVLTAVASAALPNERAGANGNGTVFVDAGANATFNYGIRTPVSITSTSTNSAGNASTGHTHEADSTIARTSQLHDAVTAGDGIDLTGQQVSVDVTDFVGNGLVEVATNNIALGTPGSSTATSTNAVTASSHTHAIDSTIARSAVTISAGNGLTGGGDLSTNRTITMGTPGSSTATSTNAVTATSHTHAIDSTIARSAITISAGNGMTGGGDLTANRTLTMGTPSTLTVSTSNGVTASSHTHAITSSSSVSTATATLLATDSNGRTQVRGLGVNGATAGNYLTNNGDTLLGHTSFVNTSGHSGRKVEIRGTNPLFTIVNSVTDRALVQFECSGGHDNMALLFDSYYDGTNVVSSNATSNYRVTKLNHIFSLDYAAGVTVGNTASFTHGLSMDRFGGIYVNDTANAQMTIGLTINQGGNNNEALAIKSSDVSQAATSEAEADTYFAIKKISALPGGALIRGYTTETVAAQLAGVGAVDDTVKSSSSKAYVELRGHKVSGSSLGNAGANANIVAIRNNASTVWIVDTEGDTHRDGTDNVFDDYHDAHLARAFDRAVSPGAVIDSEFDSWVQYGRDDLVKAGILHESGFYNESRLLRLAVGAVWQEYTERQRLAQRVQELERRLLN